MKRYILNCFSLICAVLYGFAMQGISRAQWPQYGGMQANFQSANPDSATPIALGTWSIELGLGDAPPIVDRGLVFVTEAASTENGQETMNVRCIRPSNGETIWLTSVDEKSYVSQDISDNYPVRPLASLVAAANRIVAVSFGGCISCLDQETGHVVWKHDLVQEFAATPIQYGFASSPWSDGTKVVVPCGGPQALLVAFDLMDGKLVWKTSPAEAAYGSFALLELNDESKHLCYVGRDSVVGVDPKTGKEFWTYPLPKPGLTNTVTPISNKKNQLIVGGQGFESSRCLNVTKVDGIYKVDEVWKSQQTPFYCNYILMPSSQEIIGYKSNTLNSINSETGKLNWRVRGWTDANFAISGETIVGIRGDGFLALANLSSRGVTVKAGARVVNDRVWAPPVVVGNIAMLRGRNTLSAVALDQLPSIDQMPAGTSIDSMTAMYGEQHESLVNLFEIASNEAKPFRYEDYQKVVNDRSIRIGEREYRSLLESLTKSKRFDLMTQIARDWSTRDPNSIVAFDKLVEAMENQGLGQMSTSLKTDRFVEVEIEVKVPEGTADDVSIYLSGNAAAIGSWKPDGVLLKRTDAGRYRGTICVPKGRFEFKITQGSWDTTEVGSGGRTISNRRRVIHQPETIRVEVEAWKSKAKK